MKNEVENSGRRDIEMSVVVAVIEGGKDPMESCLTSLEKGMDSSRVETIVPYDSRLKGVDELADRFPWVDFVDATGEVDSSRFGNSSREHHDILRSIGLKRTNGPIVALLEDHGTPSEGWCDAMLKAHQEDGVAAVGGAVANGVDRILNWAVYYCDFGRYQNPVPEGDVEFLSDSNVSYKREVLWEVEPLWSKAFHETSVNWEISRRGYKLRLDPGMVVFQTRSKLKFLSALWERFVWGRSFAGTRVGDISAGSRIVLVFTSFLLPFILTGRILLRALSKKKYLNKLFLALPIIFVLETVWAAGEFVGYVTGKAASQT
ncbi:MAG: glycosyltransferase [Acidobacteria bacterium]|nr:MAG: glycosyltransferase [Acidobacteriota bacterium]REK01182.1 MAG: glycosyltransferase [Acidobacteriota bacterium]REK14138.1 MAG: glycosyltransferase [Acidobacteriota bacterium]REK44853.1 MAG: glycosyltransferase [Acidobacteriota bacterium]